MKRLSRVYALPLAPALIPQARHLRRTIPRLPDAELPWSGELFVEPHGPGPINLLVMGDSTAAGVGAATQDDALPGNLARYIRDRSGRGTRWLAVGRGGATARDLLIDHLAEATGWPADLIFVSIGANDALGFRSRGAFRRDVAEVVRRLRAAHPTALILVSLMPRFDRFTSLTNPVRWNLALHAASLDDAARAAVAGLEGVFAIPKPPPYTTTFWASDGFHPGPDGYREWIDFAMPAVPEAMLDGMLGEKRTAGPPKGTGRLQ